MLLQKEVYFRVQNRDDPTQLLATDHNAKVEKGIAVHEEDGYLWSTFETGRSWFEEMKESGLPDGDWKAVRWTEQYFVYPFDDEQLGSIGESFYAFQKKEDKKTFLDSYAISGKTTLYLENIEYASKFPTLSEALEFQSENFEALEEENWKLVRVEKVVKIEIIEDWETS